MTVIAESRRFSLRRSAFADVLRSEACKLGSVRSSVWTLLAVVASNVIFAAAAAIVLPGHLSAHEKATIDSIRVSLAGLHVSQIAIGVLGVLVITSEYSSGMIRATFSAVPRRRSVLAAKAAVFTATALVVCVLASLAAYFVFQAFLPGRGLSSSITDPGVLRAVLGAGLYLTVVGLLGLGLGAVLRSSAGAIATLFGVLFIPTILAGILPQTWQNRIAGYLPMNAGDAIYSLHRESGSLAPWAGFGVFGGYAALALALGFVLITRRDA
jgi:ABC-type transport system involved in multi-copper enzyme maturation permease subunit